jgi:acetyl/propionyl-CoA carboxylase alpha subunit
MSGSVKRLFIANRGEIARRIATTARRLGVESVAVSDRAVPPAYLLGVVTSFVSVAEESPALYLDADRMVQLAKDAGCDSVHPGFGFLSENAGFAQKVLSAGLTWVGPNPNAILAMASKGTARELAEKAGVPCIAGLNGFPLPGREDGDFSVLEAFADATGYPLLIKAAFGGGGKGMRQVHQKSELRAAALRARSEAVSSFGDGTLICEQYLTAPRHVEVQILADCHGQVAAIGDRDCSLQRRHQKIIEEAPAPGLTPETRKALHRAAVDLARRVGYDSAGTVEFLLDWSEGSRHAALQKFYFLEMNTRLQVEHPVTEEVFGLDLVEWQIRIARGERLPEAYTQLAPRGHSVEVRIYAEDARQDFFPAPGAIAAFQPADGPGIRWESGIDAIDVVTGRFDPMIAKLVATGATREVALARLKDALERSFLAGPATNIDLLIELTGSGFAEEPVTTHFLKDELPSLLAGIDARYEARQALASELLALIEANALAGQSLAPAVVDTASLTELAYSSGYGNLKASSPAHGVGGHAASGFDASWQGAADPRQQARAGAGLHRGVDGKQTAFWYAVLKAGSTRKFWVSLDGLTYSRELARASASLGTASAQTTQDIVAPVPGKVIAVKVSAGDQVKAGAPVFVLESMKMEFEVKAARTGCVRTVEVKVGEQVTAGRQLATWSEDGQ